MPYVSSAQRRFAHTKTAKKKGFPTEEFDDESKGMTDKDLPTKKKKGKKKKRPVNFKRPGY